jgi:hypothetical protein
VAGQIGIITCDDKDRNPYVVTLEGGMKSDFYSESEIEIVSDKAPDPRATPPAKPLPVGTLVTRGPDWEWGEQDGGPGNVGEVIPCDIVNKGLVRVKWTNGYVESYRMGYDGKFDLKVVDYPTLDPLGYPYGQSIQSQALRESAMLINLFTQPMSIDAQMTRYLHYHSQEHIESRSEIRARLLGL